MRKGVEQSAVKSVSIIIIGLLFFWCFCLYTLYNPLESNDVYASEIEEASYLDFMSDSIVYKKIEKRKEYEDIQEVSIDDIGKENIFQKPDRQYFNY